jgi:formate--tetrahydrofolate ligase
VVATRAALKLGDYAVTEAGFGADLGAEKFVDIKCRASGLRPSAAVVVATVRALKFHGGVEVADVEREDLAALERGLPNLERHLRNLQGFGLRCVVAINHRAHDTGAEIELLARRVGALGVPVEVARHYAEGAAGAEGLAHAVVKAAADGPAPLRFTYDDDLPLWDKMAAVATRIYGAGGIEADSKVRAQIARLQADGYGRWPVCVAKTQYSFSTDPKLRGAPSGHVVNIREVRLAAGAEFIVMICGDIMTMPGLPKLPAACNIDIDESGRVVGMF